MDLSLSAEEHAVVDSVRSLAATIAATRTQAGPGEYVPRETPRAWTDGLAAAGWLGLLVPERHGGSDAPLFTTALAFEELGAAAAPIDFLISSIVATLLVRDLAPPALQDELLPGVADGSIVLGVAGVGAAMPTAAAGLDHDGATITATTDILLGADAITHLLVPLKDPGGLRFAVLDRAGFELRPLAGFLAGGAVAELQATVDRRLNPVTDEQLLQILEPALAITAAFQVGGCTTLLDKSLAYANSRRQFGRRIGAFQRVQDHAIRVLNARDEARWATYEALWRLETDRGARVSVHLAKAIASDSYHRSADAAHELHAAIGCDPMAGVTGHTLASRSLYHFLGAPRWHQRRMVDLLAGPGN